MSRPLTWIWIFDADYPFRQRMFEDRPPRPEVDRYNDATLCEFRLPGTSLPITRDLDVRDTLRRATAYGRLDVHIYPAG